MIYVMRMASQSQRQTISFFKIAELVNETLEPKEITPVSPVDIIALMLDMSLCKSMRLDSSTKNQVWAQSSPLRF